MLGRPRRAADQVRGVQPPVAQVVVVEVCPEYIRAHVVADTVHSLHWLGQAQGLHCLKQGAWWVSITGWARGGSPSAAARAPRAGT